MSNGNGGTAVARREQPKAQNLYKKLKAMEPKIAEVAVEQLPPERLIGVVMTGVLKTPKLLDCSFESILHAVMEAGQLGLEPSGPQGHAYLVPRWNRNTNGLEAHLQLGYKGLISLARRSGRVRDVEAHVVREHDAFDWKLGIDPVLDHTPNLDGDRGHPTHVYAIAWPTDPNAHPIFEVMSREQVEHIRQHSADEKSPAWKHFWDQMARKTVIRRLCNYLDLTPDVAKVIERDDERAFPAFRDGDGPEELQGPTRTEKVEALIAGDEPEPPEDGPLEEPGDPDLETLEQMAGVDAEKRAEILGDIEGDPESDPRAYKAYRDRLSGIVDENMAKEA